MTYNKKDITSIILKNEYDGCTPEELKVLEEWYENLDDKVHAKKYEESNKDLKKKTIWEAVNTKIDEMESKDTDVVEFKPGNRVFPYILRIAAMLILILGSYFTFNWFKDKSVEVTSPASKYIAQINNSNKAQKIILPDNSLLWLHPKSSIKYPELFINDRSISLLAGKVFFNVAHDSSRPFTVETKTGLKTTVLGTAFVIEKGDSESWVKVSVLRGKVQVADDVKKYATLTKNQGVDVNTTSKMANLSVVDSLEMTNWFAAKVVLDDVTLKEVAASIKENFGYKIEFLSSKLSTKPCSITYNAADNLDDILILLDKIYHTTHIFSDSTIYIKPAR